MSTAPLKAYTLSLHDALPISVDDTALRRRLTGREARPRAAGELADENVACAVDGDAVRRGELPRQDAAMRLAEPRQDLALQRVDRDTRADIRPVLVDLAGRAAFADIA